MKSMKFNTSVKYKNNKFQIKYLKANKFTSLIQVCSDGFFLDSTYAIISCLYTLCNGLSISLVTESGFKLEKFTIS